MARQDTIDGAAFSINLQGVPVNAALVDFLFHKAVLRGGDSEAGVRVASGVSLSELVIETPHLVSLSGAAPEGEQVEADWEADGGLTDDLVLVEVGGLYSVAYNVGEVVEE